MWKILLSLNLTIVVKLTKQKEKIFELFVSRALWILASFPVYRVYILLYLFVSLSKSMNNAKKFLNHLFWHQVCYALCICLLHIFYNYENGGIIISILGFCVALNTHWTKYLILLCIGVTSAKPVP